MLALLLARPRPRAGRHREKLPTDTRGGGGSEPLPPNGESRARFAERHLAIRRAAYFALTLVAIALTVRAIIGERGLLDAHRSKQEMQRVSAEVERWKQRNAALEQRIHALKHDPATIEALARERLDWVRPGEITFLFPHDPASPEPGDEDPVTPGEFAPTFSDEIAKDEPGGGAANPRP